MTEEGGKYALQNVMVKRSVPLEEAEKHYKNITKRKPRKVRETAEWWRFRYLPPTKFEPRSFRTKVVSPDIHLTFGKLKGEHAKLEGRGLFDYFKKGYDYVANKARSAFDFVKNAVSITDYSEKTKALLNQYGDLPIVKLVIRRVPLNFALDLALQGVSAGKWMELKEKYGFDKFFHLSLIAYVKPSPRKMVNLQVEKLEVVSVNENTAPKEGQEELEVPLVGKRFTIRGMLQKTRERMGETRFFSYSALGANNCQDFVANLLQSEDLYRQPERDFTFQDLEALAKELPENTKAIALGVTHLAGLANKYLGVGGSRVGLNELVGGAITDEFMKNVDDVINRVYKKHTAQVGVPKTKDEQLGLHTGMLISIRRDLKYTTLSQVEKDYIDETFNKKVGYSPDESELMKPRKGDPKFLHYSKRPPHPEPPYIRKDGSGIGGARGDWNEDIQGWFDAVVEEYSQMILESGWDEQDVDTFTDILEDEIDGELEAGHEIQSENDVRDIADDVLHDEGLHQPPPGAVEDHPVAPPRPPAEGGKKPNVLAEWGLEGGTASSGFIQAMMAKESKNPAVKERFEGRISGHNDKIAKKQEKGDKRVREGKLTLEHINDAKFHKMGAFDINHMTKATKNLMTHKKQLTVKEATKQFYDFLLKNAPQHQPKTGEDGTNYRGTHDIPGMFQKWKEDHKVEIKEEAKAPKAPKKKAVVKEEVKEEISKVDAFLKLYHRIAEEIKRYNKESTWKKASEKEKEQFVKDFDEVWDISISDGEASEEEMAKVEELPDLPSFSPHLRDAVVTIRNKLREEETEKRFHQPSAVAKKKTSRY